MELYIIPAHLGMGQWLFIAVREEDSEKKWPPWLRPSSCFDHWLEGHMAVSMIQKLMRVSLKSTVFPASPQSF